MSANLLTLHSTRQSARHQPFINTAKHKHHAGNAMYLPSIVEIAQQHEAFL